MSEFQSRPSWSIKSVAKRSFGFLYLGLFSFQAYADAALRVENGHITLPWTEFEALYKKQFDEDKKAKRLAAQVYTIESADYAFELRDGVPIAKLLISGKVVSGDDSTIPLGLGNAAITEVKPLENGAIIRRDNDYALFIAGASEFAVEVSLVAAIERSGGSTVLRLNLPKAVRNSLSFSLPEGHVLEPFGAHKAADQRWHFAARDQLELKLRRELLTEKGKRLTSQQDDVPQVLESAVFEVTVADNGRQLTTLSMRLPKNYGQEFSMPAPINGEFWSLKVNGQRRNINRLGQNDAKHWAVALLPDSENVIEVAWLKHGASLGLDGRLNLEFPATGITADELRCWITLPKRLNVMAAEGALTSVSGEFRAGLYGFSLPFYQGKAQSLAVHYHEPADS